MEKITNLFFILLCFIVSSYEKEVTICKTVDSESGEETFSSQTVYLQGAPGLQGPKGDPGPSGSPAVFNYTFITQFIEKELKRIVEENKTLPTPAQEFHSKVLQAQSSLRTIFNNIWYNYDYDDGILPINMIKDGGNDMFDNPSNQIKIYKNTISKEYLNYSTSASFPTYDLSVGGTVGTYPFVAVAWINNTQGLQTQYNIQVDNFYGPGTPGTSTNTSGNFVKKNNTVQYYAFQIYGTTRPTVCEVFFTFAHSGISNTNFSMHIAKFDTMKKVKGSNIVRITGRPQKIFFGYALLSQYRRYLNGKQTTDQQIQGYLGQLDINADMYS